MRVLSLTDDIIPVINISNIRRETKEVRNDINDPDPVLYEQTVIYLRDGTRIEVEDDFDDVLALFDSIG